MGVQHEIPTCHKILKHLSKYKIGHFDFYLDYGVDLASLICVTKKNKKMFNITLQITFPKGCDVEFYIEQPEFCF